MLQTLVLCTAVVCASLTARGAAQPARCGATFAVDDTRPSFIIVPDVDNCFSCPFPTWSLEDGEVTRGIGTISTPIAGGATTAIVEAGYLVISMPQLYVLIGNVGRRDIFCTASDGRTYEARLSSPALAPPLFDDVTVREGDILTLNCLNTVSLTVSRLQIHDPNGMLVGSNKFTEQNVTRSFAGTYTCTVSSTVSNSSIDPIVVTAEVIIEYAPEITPVNLTTTPYLVPLGSELRLSCSYVGVPSADVLWIQNDTISLMGGSGGVAILEEARGSTTLSTIVISSVSPESRGTYTCNATNTVGSDTASYPVLIVVPPGPVTNLMVTNVGETEISLSWMTGFDGFSPITGVVADVIAERGTNITNVSLSIDGVETITGLMPFRAYTFSVAVVNMIGLSDRKTISNSTLSLRLGIPTNIMFVAESSTNILLRWEAPMFDLDTTDQPSFYIVEFMRSGGRVLNTTNMTANQRNIDYQNLDKGVEYQASITAYNVRGPGITSPPVTTQTLVDPPSMPQNVMVEGVGATALRVSWAAPADDGGRPVNMYRVVVTTLNPPFVADVSVSMGTTRLIRDSGLMENTTYTVAVSASNLEQGFGMNATAMGTTQSIEEPQTIFDLPTSDDDDSTMSTAVLMWQFPGGTVDTYLVQYVLSRSDFETGMVVNVTVNGSDTSVKVENLLPGSTYQFRVAVLNDRGMSTFGPAGLFQTMDPARPTITSSHSNPVLPGTDVTLTCRSTLQGAVYSWTGNDDTDIVNNNQFEVASNTLRILRVDESSAGTYECTASVDNGNVQVSSVPFRVEVQPIPTPPSPGSAIDQTVIIIVAVVGGVALLIFIIVVIIAVCCLWVMRKRTTGGKYPVKMSKLKSKEPQNVNWIETSTQFVPATGNPTSADTGNPSDRLAFDYSVDLQTHSSFSTLEKNAVHSTAGPAQPVGVHAPVAPGSQYEVGSPSFQYQVPSQEPAIISNDASGELPSYVNTTTVV